jgi:hypothetical protein
VREFQLEWDRLEPGACEVDEEEQAEVVAQVPVDAVVVEEVAEVVEDAWGDAVEDVRGVAGDEGAPAFTRACPARRTSR